MASKQSEAVTKPYLTDAPRGVMPPAQPPAASTDATDRKATRMSRPDWTFDGTWPYEPRWSGSPDGRLHYVDEGPARASRW